MSPTSINHNAMEYVSNDSMETANLNSLDNSIDINSEKNFINQISNVINNKIDNLNNDISYVGNFSNRIDSFKDSAKMLKLQKKVSDIAVNTQIMSKVVSTTIKGMETLIHIQ